MTNFVITLVLCWFFIYRHYGVWVVFSYFCIDFMYISNNHLHNIYISI
jgi:hypothetical protein